MSILNAQEWESFVATFPNAHLLQSAQWGTVKQAYGWEPVYVQNGEGGALVLFRKLPLGFTFAYIPKGPVGQPSENLWLEIDRLCRSRNAVFLKVEPDRWEDGSDELPAGFTASAHTIQPPRTILVDIDGSEEQILNRMKQKTRYNIRLALRKGIVITPSSNFDVFADLMAETGERDAFGVHSLDYYQKVFDQFQPHGACEMLFAEFEHEPLAAIMVFARGNRAWYFYGASSNRYRNFMPTYLLQWEGIRWAREQGCTEYDLWGIPDASEAELEESFTERRDGLWGVYRFKRGFGGEVRRAAGPWDRIYRPVIYRLYQAWAARKADG
jgi:lipid II:glycine glycyltransferase (peptidoglycan interpeptide bridge formation enzyme)